MKDNAEVSKSPVGETQWIERIKKSSLFWDALNARLTALSRLTEISRKLAALAAIICLISPGVFAQAGGSTNTGSPTKQERDPYVVAAKAYKDARKANPLRSTGAVTEAYRAAFNAVSAATLDGKIAQKAADAAIAAAGEQNYLVDETLLAALASRPRTVSPSPETAGGTPPPSDGGTPGASTATTSGSNGCGTCGTRLNFVPQSGPGTTRTIEGYEIRHNLDNTYDVSTSSGHFYHVTFDAHGQPVFNEYYLVIGSPVVSSARPRTSSTTTGGSAAAPCENGPGGGSTGSCGDACVPGGSGSRCGPTSPSGPNGPCIGGTCSPDESKCQPTTPSCGPTQHSSPGVRVPGEVQKEQTAPIRQGTSVKPTAPAAAQIKAAAPVTRKR